MSRRGEGEKSIFSEISAENHFSSFLISNEHKTSDTIFYLLLLSICSAIF